MTEGKAMRTGQTFQLFQESYWATVYAQKKKMKLDLYFLSSTKANSMWIENIPMEKKTIDFSEGNTGKSFHNLKL